MSIYSKQKWFCNNCGKEQFSEFPLIIGAKEKCCSMNCLREWNWRLTLSTLGKEYYPQDKIEKKSQVDPKDCYRGCELCDGASNCTCSYCHKENK